MSAHNAKLLWTRDGRDFSYRTYSRNHLWRFENGASLGASAAQDFLGDPSQVDPEQAFVASLSSCHMLTFLAIASRQSLVIERYEDEATGYLEKNESGRLVITRVELRPRIEFAPDVGMDRAKLAALHDQAHHECFLANSVTCEIRALLD